MSHIDDLIQDLCPNGVDYRAISEAGSVRRGKRFVKKDMRSEGAPCIHYGEIYTSYGTWTKETISYLEPELASRLRTAQPGEVILATAGEAIEDLCKAVAWLGESPVVVHDACYVINHEMNPRYLSYVFQSRAVKNQVRPFASTGKISSISVKDVGRIIIPVPPIEVQDEIVRILDTFSALTAELEAELEARRTQYEHYRGTLLSGTSSEDEWSVVELKDVADILVGYAFKSKEFTTDLSGVRLLRGDNIGQGRLKDQDFKRWPRRTGDGFDRYELAEGDVVLAMDRPWIPAGLKWAIVNSASLPALLVQRVARLRGHQGTLDQRFLAHVIGSPSFTRHVLNVQTGNTVPHISSSAIGGFRFSLPPVQEQVWLAGQLDRFEALVNGVSIGLPAEIEARRKQYEYYRDRLLAFKEAPG